MAPPMPSWRHTFKAHRVAANMGNIQDNFVYHRERESFPAAMQPRSAARRASRFRLPAWMKGMTPRMLPGGSRGLSGIAFGMTLPLLGGLVLCTFISSFSNESSNKLALVQQVMQQQTAAKPNEV
mmetsp:Transcript_34983/g.96760  ORF Transcript_34983/g.96760 Transcript_34983/m.96760 type:complete len:125 (+) Transcript_34983:67-441(+)